MCRLKRMSTGSHMVYDVCVFPQRFYAPRWVVVMRSWSQGS